MYIRLLLVRFFEAPYQNYFQRYDGKSIQKKSRYYTNSFYALKLHISRSKSGNSKSYVIEIRTDNKCKNNNTTYEINTDQIRGRLNFPVF